MKIHVINKLFKAAFTKNKGILLLSNWLFFLVMLSRGAQGG